MIARKDIELKSKKNEKKGSSYYKYELKECKKGTSFFETTAWLIGFSYLP